MINVLFTFFAGVFVALMLFISITGDAILFYGKYEACNKDFECFRKVIELQNEAKQ